VFVSAETLHNIKLLAPEVFLTLVLCFLFVVDGLLPKVRSNRFSMITTVVGCVVAILLTCKVGKSNEAFFSGMVVNDGLTQFFRYFFYFTAAVSSYAAFGSKEIETKSRMEFSLLLLCITIGMGFMALASNLLVLYMGIEMVSIVSFVMAGFRRDNLRSNEASFKYLVFGGVASGLMIYGFSLIYGLTGSLSYPQVTAYLNQAQGNFGLIFWIGLVLVYSGLAYKISAFPMHFWAPDVYEGAPTPVVTFFSVGPKAAGFAALLRMILTVFAVKTTEGNWQAVSGLSLTQVVAILSAATMVMGNLSAIGQTNVKRILAYSSIAHVGYMLMGLVTLDRSGLSAILFYLIAYCAMNLGAFWVVSVVASLRGRADLDAFSGLGWSMPVLGSCMAIFIFSLTGIPMFSGFIGKFLIFGSLIKSGGFLWLALLGVLNSVVSLYYYIKILKVMWLDKPEAGETLRLSSYHAVGLIALAVPTIVLGLYFTPILEFAEKTLSNIL
jgi:NADH-quinone oxidoreductase subunit N